MGIVCYTSKSRSTLNKEQQLNFSPRSLSIQQEPEQNDMVEPNKKIQYSPPKPIILNKLETLAKPFEEIDIIGDDFDDECSINQIESKQKGKMDLDTPQATRPSLLNIAHTHRLSFNSFKGILKEKSQNNISGSRSSLRSLGSQKKRVRFQGINFFSKKN